MKRAVIFFTKVPEEGTTKTRLQNFLTKAEIVALHSKLIKQTYDLVKFVGADTFVFASPSSSFFILRNIIENPNQVICQQDQKNDLGVKMYRAFEEVFEQGYDQIVLIGSDLVYLTLDHFESAFEALFSKDVVIAPTTDGGYGLIGLRKLIKPALLNIQYSCPTVVDQLSKQLNQHHFTLCKLPMIKDIDLRDDIVSYELDDPSAQFYAQGEYNSNFIVDQGTKLFRYALGSQMHLDHQIEYEYLTLKALEPSGVTPKVYRLEKKPKLLGKAYLIEEFLPGQALDYRKDLKTAAFILSRIHKMDTEKFPHLLKAQKPLMTMLTECQEMFQVYRDWQGKNTQVESLIQDLFIRVQKINLNRPLKKPCVINTELNSGNFLINGDDIKQAYLVDWEKPLIGEKEQDIGHFLAPTTTLWKTDVQLSLEEIDVFIADYNGFLQSNPIDNTLLTQYICMNILRGLTWSSMAYCEYSMADKTAMHEDTFDKISMYLKPSFIKSMQVYFPK